MKFVNVKFTGKLSDYKDNMNIINNVKAKLVQSYAHPNQKYGEEYRESNKLLEEEWKNISIEEAAEKYPKGVNIEGNYVISMGDYEKIFQHCEILHFINLESEFAYQQIDLEKLANNITTSMLGKTGSNLFNQKLNIHQPNMPLFTYNQFQVLTDFCTEKLQNEYINQGWRVVAICPQPDQRRPDYIIARYENEGIWILRSGTKEI